MRFLADECCPRAVVSALRKAGYDVRYAAETKPSVSDRDLLQMATAEQRVIVTEDFDFGELLLRDKHASCGAIIMFLPKLSPAQRAERLLKALSTPGVEFQSAISIIEPRRLRQRLINS